MLLIPRADRSPEITELLEALPRTACPHHVLREDWGRWSGEASWYDPRLAVKRIVRTEPRGSRSEAVAELAVGIRQLLGEE